MLYLTVRPRKKWGLAPGLLPYTAENKIGAVKRGNLWLIPEHAQRPIDKAPSAAGYSAPAFGRTCSHSGGYHRRHAARKSGCDSDTVNEERMRLQYEGEIAYLRGDFKATMACFRKPGK